MEKEEGEVNFSDAIKKNAEDRKSTVPEMHVAGGIGENAKGRRKTNGRKENLNPREEKNRSNGKRRIKRVPGGGIKNVKEKKIKGKREEQSRGWEKNNNGGGIIDVRLEEEEI